MAQILLLLAALACLVPALPGGAPAWLRACFPVAPWAALIGGVLLALTVGNPFAAKTKKITPRLLAYSVVGLGAAMNLVTVGRVGLHGFVYTIVGLSVALILGVWLGRRYGVLGDTALLISVGTAICGGSAIAAAAPTLRAKDDEVSVALAIVFMLNACALVIFPPIGHHFHLSETQFGLWSALAIHDTSSVVGSAVAYGGKAVEVATTVKLARALWIVPLTLALGFWVAKARHVEGEPKAKAKRPWFILGFLLAAALVTFVPTLKEAGHFVSEAAKRSLVLTLFLIGAGLSRQALKSVGLRPFLHGVTLWFILASGTLAAILRGWIS